MLTGHVSVSTRNVKGTKMAIIDMAKNLKRIHPDYVMLYKVGSFYHAYGKDSYIKKNIF